jgi:hypothetical protein
MGRTKTQRETRLVIKIHQNNNNKKHRNFFWEGTRTYQFILGRTSIIIIITPYKNIFEEMGGDHGPSRSPLPPSLYILDNY